MLGDKIRELRKQKHLTQGELGKIINITGATVGMYEMNTRKPSYDVLVKLSKYFGVTTDYLLNDDIEEDNKISYNISTDDLIDTLLKSYNIDIDKLKKCDYKKINESLNDYLELLSYKYKDKHNKDDNK